MVKGIDAGDRVVVDGRQNLRAGVAVVERSASAPGGGRPASAAFGNSAGTGAAASGAVPGTTP